ncbi:MAG TPA: rod shape-determining protein MreC [Candidatus Acidoferrum sp.]|nr:rod shape-determining protein MreC [Candidatus Acidoferrum sp.]
MKRSQYIILVLVVLLVVVLLSLPRQTAERLKPAINGLFLPLFGLAATSREVAAKAGDALTPREELLRERDTLRTSNQLLRLQLQAEANLPRENEELRQMLNFRRQKAAWNLQAARVIARDPETWWRSVWIDVGSRTTPGMRTNLPVLTEEGLAGKVVNVGETRSQVLLLGDPGLRVAVLAGPAGLNGTATAGSWWRRENNMIDIENLFGETADKRVHPGDEVVTWGAGGVFPGGIAVGKVVDVERKESGGTTEVRAQISAHLEALQNVWVMILP